MKLYAAKDEPTVACDECGTRFREARHSCPRCGTGRTRTDPEVDPTNRRSRPETALVGGGLALAALVVALLGWPSDRPSTQVSQAAMISGGRSQAVRSPIAHAPAGAIEAAPVPKGPPAFLDDRGAATVAYNEGRVEDALDRFQAVLEQNPGDPEALNNVGQVLVRLGRASEALSYFEQAVERFPDRWDFQFNLARALGEAGRWTEAVERYRFVAAERPDDDVTAFNLARALERAGQMPEAITTYKRAVELAPNDPSFHLALALANERVGDRASARRAYDGYLALLPEGDEAQRVRAHLSSLPVPAANGGDAPVRD